MDTSVMEHTRLTYRVEEVGKLLGVPKPTLYRWIREGCLPATQVGRVLLIPVQAVQDLLNGGKHMSRLIRERTVTAQRSGSV